MKLIKHGRLAILIGLLCPVLYASEIDLKLTTSDGSTQVSVVNAAATSVAAIDSTGDLKFQSALMPNSQAGTAGQILQSNGPNTFPLWVSSTPLPSTLLDLTNTWTVPQTFDQSVTVSSNLIVTNGGTLSGDGSGLSNLQPGSISAGILPISVVASSIAATTVYPDAVTAGVYGTISGLGSQGQALDMGGHPVTNVGGPAADADAATKAYVDTATGTASAALVAYVDTATGTLNASLISYVDSATGTLNASLIAYVDTATGAVNASVWSSTGNWTAQQTFTHQITVSTTIVLTGDFLANGSAGTSGQLLKSMGSGSAPQWVSSTTYLGGTPILKQGPLNLSFSIKSDNYSMTAADFAILGDATAAGITITLPPASNAGMVVMIVKMDASVHNVDIARTGGSDTIEGNILLNLTAQHQKYMLIADGTSTWYILSQ